LLVFQLDLESPDPAYLQIRDRVVDMVEQGALRAGDRLPPTRRLADSLGVHRSTVVRAYAELRALGYLESRSGSYSYVRRRSRPPATRSRKAPGARSPSHSWTERVPVSVEAAHRARLSILSPPREETTIDFERLAADPNLAPTQEVRRCLKSALVRRGALALDYADPAGWPELRETIARRLRAHGVSAAPDEILITSGAQHALDLLLRAFTRPGDRVAVEAPTYAWAHPMLRLQGLEALEVPMGPEGLDLDRLERSLETTGAKLLYTMPNFHNPTGITTDQAHRERLLEICERRRVPIVEDGFEEEMKYFGRSVLPIKSIDVDGLVIYVGTFSKVVFPGLRVGWLAAARPAIERLTSLQHVSCLGTNTLGQAAADVFCRRGEFEAHLRRIHRVYRRRMQAMLDGLARHLPSTVTWTRPAGGYTLWLTLPGQAREEPLWVDRLREAGVRVSPGRIYFGQASARPHARLSIACAGEESIESGCRRLGAALRAS
jgi:DNA-binding transcriptional MocR family regulator